MGQAIATPVPCDELIASNFINVSKQVIETLWTSYNLYGEGWGLSLDDVVSIFESADQFVITGPNSEVAVADRAQKLFEAFDTDKNGLVDALELFITIALISGMDTIDKLYFVFSVYDFDSCGSISLDETALLLRSATKGLNKACPEYAVFQAPASNEASIETYAKLIFEFRLTVATEKTLVNDRASLEVFREYCSTHVIISSWLNVLASMPSFDEVTAARFDREELIKMSSTPTAPPKPSSTSTLSIARNPKRDNALSQTDYVALQALYSPVIETPAEEAKEPTVEGDEASIEAPAPVVVDTTPLWKKKVVLSNPDEMPPLRPDAPEDSFEPAWVCGMTAATGLGDSVRWSGAKYHSSAGTTGVVYSASSHLVHMQKPVVPAGEDGEDEGAAEEAANATPWTQLLYSEHSSPITCMQVQRHRANTSADRSVMVTVDDSGCVCVWQTAAAGSGEIKLLGRFAVTCTVNVVDVSSDGKLILLCLNDTANTVCIYTVPSFSEPSVLLFSKELSSSVTVTDALFTQSSSLFVVATNKGIRFFVQEGGSFMGAKSMRSYEERAALYSHFARALAGVAVTSLCRFEKEDQVVCGTEKGQVVVWHNRSCFQVLEETHISSVTCLDFNSKTLTLISGDKSGYMNLFDVNDLEIGPSVGVGRKGPVMATARMLSISASFDILHLPELYSYNIKSAYLFPMDSSRVLITTSSCDLVELSLKIKAPKIEIPEEGGDDEEKSATGEGAGAIPAAKGRLGEYCHGRPIMQMHCTAPAFSGAITTCLAKIPSGGGFVSCGTDCTVRVWQSTGASEGEEGGPSSYKIAQTIKMDAACMCIDVSSAGVLAVALEGNSENMPTRTGSIHLFSFPDCKFMSELSYRQESIIALTFSSDGATLAAATSTGEVLIIVLGETGWALKDSLNGPDAPHKIDFSSDNQYLRCSYLSRQNYFVFDLRAESFGTEVTAIYTETQNPDAPNPYVEVLKGLTWNTQTCPYAWDTANAGTLTLPAESTMVSMSSCFDRTAHLLLCGLSDGNISVERTPCAEVPVSTTFKGHVSGVSSVLFMDEGTKLVTAGSIDGTIIVWKVTLDMDEFEPDDPPPPADGEEAAEPEAEAEEEEEADEDGPVRLPAVYDSGEDEDLVYDDIRLKEHLTYVAPSQYKDSALRDWPGYLAGLTATSLPLEAAKVLSASPSLLPTDELQIEYVYGCSSRSTRDSVRYTAEGHIVYPAGAIGVVLDKVAGKQRHSMAHCDQITALDVHLPTNMCATAHKGAGNITVVMWNMGKTLTVVRCFDCGSVSGVSAVKFSNDDMGQFIVVACQDKAHTIMVFRTVDGKQVASLPGGSKKVLNLAFSGMQYDAPTPGTLRIMQGGVKHFKILTFQPMRSRLTSKTGAYGSEVTKKTSALCSVALPLQVVPSEEPGIPPSATGNEFAVGMSDGSIGLIPRGDTKVSAFAPIMKGPVTAITVAKVKEGSADEPPTYKIICAGTRGEIRILDMELQPLTEYNLYAIPVEHGLYPLGRARGFKSLCVDKLARKILYATAGGEIGEVDMELGTNLNEQIKDVPVTQTTNTDKLKDQQPAVVTVPIVTGHFRDQLHGLCAHPFRQECVTSGDDKTLRVWCLTTKMLMAVIELPDIARTCAYSPNGHIIAVGLGGTVVGEGRTNPREFAGRVCIVSYMQGLLRIVHIAHNAMDAITSVLFTPDGSKLIAASLDANIYVYDVLNNFVLVSTMGGHEQGVTSLDMSADGEYLQSTGEGSEIILWNVEKSSPIHEDNEKFEVLSAVGTQWHVRQGSFGFNSAGVFAPYSSASEVKTLHQSLDKKLLVTGDAYGGLKLFRNPACDLYAPHKKYYSHSAGGVSKVSFTAGDQLLLSVGKHDRTLIQWKVMKEAVLPDSKPISLYPVPTTDDIADEGELQEGVDFASSFIVKGLDFTANKPAPSASPISAALKAIVGVGCRFSGSSSSLPCAQYCGQGEAIATAGKMARLLDGESKGQMRRPWTSSDEDSSTGSSDAATAGLLQDMTAMAVSSDGRFVLAGYSSASAGSKLLLFSAPSGGLVTQLSDSVEGGVSCVALSHDGHLAACLGGDALHKLYLYKSYSGAWKGDAILLCETQVSSAMVNLMCFLSYSNAADVPPPPAGTEGGSAAGYDLVTAGEGAIKFWTVCGQNVLASCGECCVAEGEEAASQVTVTSVTSCLIGGHGQAVTGGVDGKVFLWSGKKGSAMPVGQHASKVTALKGFLSEDNTSGVISASNDAVIVWKVVDKTTLLPTATFPVLSILAHPGLAKSSSALYAYVGNQALNYVTSIACDPQCRRLLLTFQSSVVATLSTDSGGVQITNEGHGKKVTGLTAHPSDPNTIATVSEDNILRVWDLSPSASGTRLVGALLLAQYPTSVVFADDKILLVAVKNGDTGGKSASVMVVNYVAGCALTPTNLDFTVKLEIVEKLHNIAAVGTTIDTMKMSPDKFRVAMCCSDGNLWMYEREPGPCFKVNKAGLLLVHSSGAPVAGCDFNPDSQFIRTFGKNNAGVNGKVKVGFFDLNMESINKDHCGVRIQQADDLESSFSPGGDVFNWASCSSAGAPEACGVTGSTSTGLEVACSVSRSPCGKVLCSGYTDGSVRFQRYPAYMAGPSVTANLHSTGAVLTTFTASAGGEVRLVSVGEVDGTIMVWKIDV